MEHLVVQEEREYPQYAVRAHLNVLHSYLFELFAWLKEFYKQFEGDGDKAINVTDTLATKILLGTLGCVPAYDRFFIVGLKKESLSYSYLNKRNFQLLIDFCMKNENSFKQAFKKISKYGMEYPEMKIVDMYFCIVYIYIGIEKMRDNTCCIIL